MAARPFLPVKAEWPEAVRLALEEFARGRISAPVALMRLALAGLPQLAIIEAAGEDDRLGPLAALARQHGAGLARLEAMVRSGAEHACGSAPDAAIAESRAMFDRLVRISPEASVAAYSLGDPGLLEAATSEVVSWLLDLGLLDGRPRILDLGCGIGRMAQALAPYAGSILGLDVSSGMIDAARERSAKIGNAEFGLTSGHGLKECASASFDLMLAVDVFPYLVQAGVEVAERHLAHAARLLRPGGSVVILNYSYRDISLDRRELRSMAARHGFEIRRDGTRDLSLWDAHAFWLRLRSMPT